MCSHYRSCSIIPAALRGRNSITVNDLLDHSAVAVVRAVPAYDSAYHRIVTCRKALADGQRKLVLGIGISEPCAGSFVEQLIKTAYS